MFFTGMGIDTWEEKKLKIKLSIMDRSTAPFEINDIVVCIDTSATDSSKKLKVRSVLKQGAKYIVTSVYWSCCCWVVTVGISAPLPTTYCICGKPQAITDNLWPFRASRFRKINPYQSSVSRSLAERAMQKGDSYQDMVPNKIEIVNS